MVDAGSPRLLAMMSAIRLTWRLHPGQTKPSTGYRYLRTFNPTVVVDRRAYGTPHVRLVSG